MTTPAPVKAPPPTVDQHLDAVDYRYLNSKDPSGTGYTPSKFALAFVDTIKLINGAAGEEHPTPAVHLKMLDNIAGGKMRTVNLCARGLAKTTLMFEYLVLYLALFNEIPGFGKVESMIYIGDSMENGVKSGRKNIEERYNRSPFLQKMIPPAGVKFTDSYMEFQNTRGKKLGCRMFGAQTTVRGVKIFGQRPNLAIMDDLVSDADAMSKVQMENINKTVYNAVEAALHPTRKKIILSGTPFNKNDIIYEAVESGGWNVNVFPVCQEFPCEEADFQGAWPERFTFKSVKEQYDFSVANGKIDSFMQEFMLRITSKEDRLVQDGEIGWFDRKKLLANLHNYNKYITTDFAFSEKEKSDFSVISVWAYSHNGDWHWIDGMCKRQTIDLTLDELFRLAQKYNPAKVGVETGGQQGIMIPWIKNMQIEKNVHFNFALHNGQLGIKPDMNKLSRFNKVVPLFKEGKILFPKDKKDTLIMREFVSEISLATMSGLKGKDDCLDTISMLSYMNAMPPNIAIDTKEDSDIWDDIENSNRPGGYGLGNYI
ncbi:MAG: hypothetical protein K0U41_06585 [Gammaproteobacteria bacterium]|nr:hypothetical protein [Gammaproteobacteria bacterium]